MTRSIALALLVLAALSTPGVTSAATVRVTVVDEDGTAVQGARVWLRRIDGGTQPGQYHLRLRHQRGDTSGRAEFTEVVQGQYRVEASTNDQFYIDDDANPLAAPAELTIDAPDQVVEVRLELHQGTMLCTRFVIDGSRLDVSGKIERHELESDHRNEFGLGREEEVCGQLFAGRWEVRLQPPRGYVLVGLEVNGVSTDGHLAQIDVRPGHPSQYVSWYLVALARLEGKVAFKGDRFGVAVQAELIEGTDWQPAADERGGSLYSPVLAYPDPQTSAYEMDLPDGRWRLTMVGSGLREAEPAELEIVLARGETRRQDFTVGGEPGEFEGSLTVSVHEPDGDLTGDAVVELWPPDVDNRGPEPIARERIERLGYARFTGLEPGSYRLVAGHPGFVENAETITYDPDDEDLRRHRIFLRQAAELKIRLDSASEPIEARLLLERAETSPLDTELADPTLLAALQRPSADLDATQRAWIRGIYPGDYTLRGSADNVFIEFQHEGEWQETLEISFAAAETRELTARAVPAGTVTASLFCKDGEPLPATVDVRVLPVTARPEDPLDNDWQSEVTIGREIVLSGERHDSLELGPLDSASYLMALQPATFDRWSWSLETENGHEAQSFEVASGRAVDLGAIGLECGPAIQLTVDVQSRRADADLSETRWGRDLQLEAVITTAERHEYEIEQARLERHTRLLTLRGLREGQIEGELRIGHDYFVPHRWIDLPLSAELERGLTLRLVAQVPDLGGALELTDTQRTSVAVRVIDVAENARIEPLESGQARVTNLAAGPWAVELCLDLVCDSVTYRWNAVEIEPVVTLELAH